MYKCLLPEDLASLMKKCTSWGRLLARCSAVFKQYGTAIHSDKPVNQSVCTLKRGWKQGKKEEYEVWERFDSLNLVSESSQLLSGHYVLLKRHAIQPDRLSSSDTSKVVLRKGKWKRFFFFKSALLKEIHQLCHFKMSLKNRLKEKGGKMLPNQQNIEKFH